MLNNDINFISKILNTNLLIDNIGFQSNSLSTVQSEINSNYKIIGQTLIPTIYRKTR